jgi:hypothetical protein
VQKLNQGSLPKKDVIPARLNSVRRVFGAPFFAERPDERSDFGSTFLLAPTSVADLGGEAKK